VIDPLRKGRSRLVGNFDARQLTGIAEFLGAHHGPYLRHAALLRAETDFRLGPDFALSERATVPANLPSEELEMKVQR